MGRERRADRHTKQNFKTVGCGGFLRVPIAGYCKIGSEPTRLFWDTTMTLSFPPGHQHLDAGMLADDLALANERSIVTAHTSNAALAGVQIMVVNGDPETCVPLQTLLGAAGATVICAYDLETVLATIVRTPPDLVLVDLDEPSADPHQSIRQLRLHERNKTLLTRLPAIALGVRGAPSDVRDALQAGFDEHLAKPYTSEELVALVAAQVLRK